MWWDAGAVPGRPAGDDGGPEADPQVCRLHPEDGDQIRHAVRRGRAGGPGTTFANIPVHLESLVEGCFSCVHFLSRKSLVSARL